MKFRTEIEKQDFPWEIGHGDHVLSLGSCFAERMGARLAGAKIPTTINPLGIAYQPMAISRQLALALSDSAPEARELNGLWHAFELHSSFNHPDEAVFTHEVKKALNSLKTAWHQANVVMLTFGTAWVYRRKDNDEWVCNCHKYPAAFFEKELLSVDGIVEEWKKLFEAFPSKNFLLTVSPVRHTKDSLRLNSLSKSCLRLAAHQLSAALPNVAYFPSYEIMMDDLRDYRFYESDLIHPNEMAEQYIWDFFSKSFFSTKTQQLIHSWGKVQQSLQHRPFQQESDAYQHFLQKLEQQLRDLSTELDVKKELAEVLLKIKK